MILSTSTDKYVRKKTGGAFLLFFSPLLLMFISYGKIFPWILFAIFLFLLFFTFLSKPTKYEVSDQQFIIHRYKGNVVINIEDIARVDRIHHDLLINSVKGGAFGYFGDFHTDLGKIRYYATRRDKVVLLSKKDNTKIAVTPDDQDGLIELLDKKISNHYRLGLLAS